MSFAIVQLSDIHIKDDGEAILSRAASIVWAIRDAAPRVDAYLLAVTGDVAFSGKKSQYQLAATFLSSIQQELRKTGSPVLQFFIPGNHDLDFTQEPDTRKALLQHVRTHPDDIVPAGETVRQILSVQDNFFEFEATMLNSPMRPMQDRLAYFHIFDVGGRRVRVDCFNTAWVSTNPEVAATLVFPSALVNTTREPADMRICAFHHPSSWLIPDNARRFRLAVENSADLILTGHEHEALTYRKQQGIEPVSTHHVEGAVLQEQDTTRSAFNVMVIDDKFENYEVIACSWDDNKYKSSSLGDYQFIRNRMARKSVFQNNETYSKFLTDPGLPILHPRKNITVDDLFIYPALAWKDPDRKFQLLRVIESNEVLEFVRSTALVVIVGDETAGKTTLAKKLYRDLQLSSDLVPLLLKAGDIKGYTDRAIRKLLKSCVEEQYDLDSSDRYFSLDLNQRVIIIDDWHQLKYAAKGRGAIVDQLRAHCGKIICLTSRLYALEELADVGPARKMFADFQFCDIKEFGKRSTGQLIEKWHSLGQEDSIDPGDFHHQVASSEDKVAAVIRKGILPTFPIFIIGLLQADATYSSGTSQNAGAYGHILELLITDRLSLVSKNVTNIGTMYTYLSHLGYSMLKKDRSFLSSNEISEVHTEYCTAYQMKLSQAQVVSNLITAKIICKEGDSYRFSYKGLYCYAVARYFFENIERDSSSTLRAELDVMVDRLAWEDYTNIVMFYLYLSRDQRTIDRLLSNAGQIYAECQPADLEADVLFINRLIKEKPGKLLLPGADISANRDEYRTRQDAIAEQSAPQDLLAPDNRVPYEPQLHELVKLTIGLQTLRVMGQVLRNFPGVLPKDPKYRLAEASYLLGLRILRRILDLAKHQMQELRTNFAEIFREKHPLATQQELEESADQTLIWLTGAAAYGVIKRICRSVGLKDLELTFEEVRRRLGDKTSVRLIHMAILLEYFRDVPKSEVYEVENDVRKNHFSYKILRDLISEFLYLRNTDFRLAQEIGQLFDIETSKPEYILNKAVGVESEV